MSVGGGEGNPGMPSGILPPSVEETFFPFPLRRRDSYAAEPVKGERAGERGGERDGERDGSWELFLAAELGKALVHQHQELREESERERERARHSEQEQTRLQSETHRLREEIQERNRENWEQRNRVENLETEVKAQEAELSRLREELERVRDGSLQEESDLVCQAISERDTALTKKRELELELDRTRREREGLNHQLLHSVTQKLRLSQELEAWQEDMQVVIRQQLQSQRQREEGQRRERDPSGLFSIFRKT